MGSEVFEIEPEVPPFLVGPVQSVGIFIAVLGVVVILSFAFYAWVQRHNPQAARLGIYGVFGGGIPLIAGILLFWLT